MSKTHKSTLNVVVGGLAEEREGKQESCGPLAAPMGSHSADFGEHNQTCNQAPS